MDELYQYLNSRISTLEKNLDAEIRAILIDVGEQTVKRIREFIQKWYDKYEPKDYIRTHELLNSVRYSIEGNKVKVYFDMRRIRSSQQNDGIGWQSHRSFNGEDFTYGLIDFFENGSNNLGSPHNPRRNDFGTHVLTDAQKWVNEYVDKEVQRRIRVLIKSQY